MQKIFDVHFFCFRPEKPVLGKSGQKNQNCQFNRKFGTKTNLNMQNSVMMFTFSVFNRKYLFGKIWSKKSNCQFELKFRTRIIWICRIMLKICDVHFLCFRLEKPFLSKSGQKNQNCQFKLKFGTKTNLNMQNSMMIFTFSAFDHKYLSWANLVQKLKIACSKWNLIQRLIWICKTQWWRVFYLF